MADVDHQARVQVLMPTFDRLPYLRIAVASILTQTFTDLSLHVSDNASTDGTVDWLASLDDPRLTYSCHETNLGWFANFNSCFDRIAPGTGYCIVFADDDVMHETYLERTVPVLDQHAEAGFVHTAFDLVGADGGLQRSRVDWTHGPAEDTVESGARFIEESMHWSCRVCQSSALMRSAAAHGLRFRIEDVPCPDFGIWLRIAKDWDVAFVADALIDSRIHESSVSATVGDTVTGGYRFSEEMIAGLYGVKSRFVDEFRDDLPNPRALRRTARHVYRGSLITNAADAARPESRRVPVLRRLVAAARANPDIVADYRAWRLAASTLAGPWITDRVRRRRQKTAT